jgi:hypothetical protein
MRTRLVGLLVWSCLLVLPSTKAWTQTCETGCNLERQACRVESCFHRTEDRTACDANCATCNESCDGDRGGCRDACDEARVVCADACTLEVEIATCRDACGVTRAACRDACGGSRGECRAQCEASRESCHADAEDVRNDANVLCDDDRGICAGFCQSEDHCVDVCGQSAGRCFHAARTTFRECRDTCEKKKPGQSCRLACRSVQVTSNAECSGTFAACLDACAPLVTTTLVESSTTMITEPTAKAP